LTLSRTSFFESGTASTALMVPTRTSSDSRIAMSTAGLTGAGLKSAVVIANVGLARETVDASGAAARRRVRAVLVGVRGVPRRRGARLIRVRTEAVRVADLGGNARRVRGPVIAREADHQRAVGVRAGEDVVLDRRRRSGPLTVDPLTVLVEEDGGVAFARVQRREAGRDYGAVDVDPGPAADPIARVRRPAAVVSVPFDAQVSAPGLGSGADRRGERLTGVVGTAQSAEVAGHAL